MTGGAWRLPEALPSTRLDRIEERLTMIETRLALLLANQPLPPVDATGGANPSLPPMGSTGAANTGPSGICSTCGLWWRGMHVCDGAHLRRDGL